MSVETVNASVLPKLFADGAHVIDVRTPSEYRGEHVSGAELSPLDQLDPPAFVESTGADTPVYILCQSGKRAEMAANKLIGAGHQKVFVVEGGTNAAKDAGVALEIGKGSISIERQVRIAAGGLVATGTLLGVFVAPGFLWIPGFVGCGLVFAGVTDFCGMGLLLAKMPWNR